MNKLASIAIYDPNRLDPDTFLKGFVARAELADFLLDKFRRTKPKAVAEHHVVIGQRGMGKTSLLRRLAIGIAREEALASRYIPLTFREEQYNVRSLDVFWRNCGEALAEWADAQGNHDLATALDRKMLEPAWFDPAHAADAFLAETKLLGRRPVLFVDNLDLILDALPADEDWMLRRVLQAPGGPILFGAATRFLRQSGDRQAAFYEFFHPHVLEPLSESELLQCMRRLADARGSAGGIVRHILARDTGRLRTLHLLTGGNPRVLTLLYQLLERAESDNVYADLEGLLDQMTPFYKARVEEYQTELQRAVIDAIALHWDPITSHDLGKATAVEVTTISSQLTRLKNDGLVEEVPTSGARAGYQLVERFFNIWYLMRHGTRRTRQKMIWLTAFLKSFYAPEELRRMQGEAGEGRGKWHPLYREALDAALEGASLAGEQDLGARAGEQADGISALLQEADEKAAEERSEEVIAIYDDVVARFGSASEPALRKQVAWALVKKGHTLGLLRRGAEMIAVLDDVVVRYGAASEPALQDAVACALSFKASELGLLGRREEAIAVYDDVVARFGSASEPTLREEVAEALLNKGHRLGKLGRREEAIAVYDDVLARCGSAKEPIVHEQAGQALFEKAVTLGALGRGEEEITVYDDVVARFGSVSEPFLRERAARALRMKATALGEMKRYEEAEAALRRGIEIAPGDSYAWLSLGNLLADHFGRCEEAEAAYHEARHVSDANLLARASLAWLWLAAGRTEEAAALRATLDSFNPVGLALLDAGLEVRADNIGKATTFLGKAIGEYPVWSVEPFYYGQLRFLRLAQACGYGEKLISWFEESGHALRQAPVYAAFVAFVRGERFLRDVNPEVRAPAEKIYRWLASLRSRQQSAPGKSPEKPKRRRGRPTKRSAA